MTPDFSEDAVEFGELDAFLRLNEKYDETIEADRPLLESQPIGVPGAATPLQMTPERLRPAVEASSKSSGSPLTGKAAIPANKRDDEFDIGEELSGFGLQGVKVSQDDLAALVEDLGLGGDDAEELVKGLSDSAPLEKKGLRIEKSDGGDKSGEAQLAKALTDAIPKKTRKGLGVEKVVSEDDAAEPSSPTGKGQAEIKRAEPGADSSSKAQQSAN
jgi:hypothetical protein